MICSAPQQEQVPPPGRQPAYGLFLKGVSMRTRTMNGIMQYVVKCLAVAYALAWAAYVVFVRGLTAREKAAMGVRD